MRKHRNYRRSTAPPSSGWRWGSPSGERRSSRLNTKRVSKGAPGYYDASLEAAHLAGIELCPRHVIVEPGLEDVVLRVVQRELHDGGLKVCGKGRFEVPLGLARAPQPL